MADHGERLSFVTDKLTELTGLRIARAFRTHDIYLEVVTPSGLVVGETNIRITDNPADDHLFGHCLGLFTLEYVATEMNKIRDEYNTKFGASV